MFNRFRKGVKRVLQSTKSSISRSGSSKCQRDEGSQQDGPSGTVMDVPPILNASSPPPPVPAKDSVAANSDMNIGMRVVFHDAVVPSPQNLWAQSSSCSTPQFDSPAPMTLVASEASQDTPDRYSWSYYKNSPGKQPAGPYFDDVPVHREVQIQTDADQDRHELRSALAAQSDISWTETQSASEAAWKPQRLLSWSDPFVPSGDLGLDLGRSTERINVSASLATTQAYPGHRAPTLIDLNLNFDRDSISSAQVADGATSAHDQTGDFLFGRIPTERTTDDIDENSLPTIESEEERSAKSAERPLRRLGKTPPEQSVEPIDLSRGWRVLQLNCVGIPPPELHKEWVAGGILGAGAFGVVYFVLNIPQCQEYAMKVINYAQGLHPSACRGIISELMTLQMIAGDSDRCPFVMRPTSKRERWAWQSSDGFIHILTDVHSGGCLNDYRGMLFPESLKLIAVELVMGIIYLHSMDIIHHDLKPGNILVSSTGHCIIADYGGVQFSKGGTSVRDPNEDVIFTPEFVAPELSEMPYFQKYDNSVDYFSLGVLLATMIIVPEHDDILLGRVGSTLEDDIIRLLGLLAMQRCSIDFITFIRDLLRMNPAERPNDENIMAHPYFAMSKREWNDIADEKCPPFPYIKTPMVSAHGSSVVHEGVINDKARYNLPLKMAEAGIHLDLDDSFDVRPTHRALVDTSF